MSDPIDEFFRKQIWSSVFLSKTCQVCVLFVFPLILGVAGGFYTGATDPKVKAPWLLTLIFFGGIQIVIGGIQVFQEKPAAQVMVEFQKLAEENRVQNKQLQQVEESAGRYLDAVVVVALILERLNDARTRRSSTLTDGIETTLRPFITEREKFFDFTGKSALWNFAVYRYCSEEDPEVLRVVWRECDPRIKKHERAWPPGTGHVGRCFMGKEILTNSVPPKDMPPELARQLKNDNDLDSDKEFYKSYTAVPIKHGQDYWGVFVLTSSAANQFSDEHEPIVSLIGIILAQIVADSEGAPHG